MYPPKKLKLNKVDTRKRWEKTHRIVASIKHEDPEFEAMIVAFNQAMIDDIRPSCYCLIDLYRFPTALLSTTQESGYGREFTTFLE